MDIAALRSYLAANFQTEWMAADHAALLSAMQGPGDTVPGVVTRDRFTIWAATTGMRAVIQDHAANTASPLRASALALQDLATGVADGLDLADPDIQDLVSAWQTAGALSAADAASLQALGAVPRSVAEAAGFAGLTLADVLRAIWNDDGTRAV